MSGPTNSDGRGGRDGDGRGGRDWDGRGNRGGGYGYWNRGWGRGGWLPLALGYGYYGPYGGIYGGYPGYWGGGWGGGWGGLYGSYAPAYYNYGSSSYYDGGSYTTVVPETGTVAPDTDDEMVDPAAGQSYFDGAVDAFRQRDYQEASRLAAHAIIDMPRDENVHELMSLALFAQGEYRGAAAEAHAALALGPAADWPTLYSYYGDLPTYESQWEALKKFRRENPDSVEATFLAAYHDLMLGHTEQARGLFAQVVKEEPKDGLAAELLKQIENGPDARTATAPERDRDGS